MSNNTNTIVRSPRMTAGPIEAAKAAQALAPESVAKITSRFVDMIDPVRFDKALQLVQMDDDAGSLSGHAYHARLKIEDIVIAARELAEAQPEPKPAKKSRVTTTKPSAERAAKAVEMRQAGATLQAIADELGYSCRQSARGAIVRALAKAA